MQEKPVELLQSGRLVKICAPMVRYSKLPFRELVRQYGCDVAYTPMIVSDAFVKSIKARDCEFTTNRADRPLVVQFAANNAEDFAAAAEIVAPYSDGVDLNCGCPQRWALQEGYGACLIKNPQLLCDIIKQTRNRIPDTAFSISLKIRVHKDLRETVDMCQRVERMGVSWVTVHGRTVEQRGEPVDRDAIRLISDSLAIPVIANGDIKTPQDCLQVQQECGVKGVMAARGILSNPAIFAGYDLTPLSCVEDWVKIALSLGIHFQSFHHHLMFMMESVTSKAEKRIFNSLSSTSAVIDYLRNNYDIL